MIISVNWLKKFTDIDISIDELTELIGARLVDIRMSLLLRLSSAAPFLILIILI
jgi:hypothetical protein